jgi:cbb3-type cytochrome c oxidase subunit III
MVRLTAFAAVAAATAVLVLGPARAAENGKDPGARLFRTKTCVACHGKDGAKAILDYPNLAGQEETYLYNQMKDIKSGKRVAGPDQTGNPRTAGMKGVMHLVKPDEMKAIADWLSKQDPPAPKEPKEPYDPERIKKGESLFNKYNCKNCHGPEGTRPLKAHPYIAGQKKSYLVNQMTDLRDRVRKNGRSATMVAFIRRASDEDIELIAEYLSQVDRTKK